MGPAVHEPRRIFTLPARHCELNGPNRVSLSPLSGAGRVVFHLILQGIPRREVDMGIGQGVAKRDRQLRLTAWRRERNSDSRSLW